MEVVEKSHYVKTLESSYSMNNFNDEKENDKDPFKELTKMFKNMEINDTND